MRFIAITGTNGKTTTATFTAQLLRSAGLNVGLRTTNSLWFGDGSVGQPSGCNPGARELSELLRIWQENAVDVVVIEICACRNPVARYAAVCSDVTALTNLSLDHGESFNSLHEYHSAKLTILSMGATQIDARHADIFYQREGFASMLSERGMGVHNAVNLCLAVALCKTVGVNDFDISAVALPAGRFEVVTSSEGVRFVVDFAHNPAAFEAVLTTCRNMLSPGKKLIAVFGAGGDRDRSKRPVMGQIAARLAERVIITSDNPRSESPYLIASQIRRGCPASFFINDRRAAIVAAVSLAQPGDVVAVLGKGDEVEILVGNNKPLPFSDKQTILELINYIS